MSVITTNGKYENLNFKNLNPTHSVTLKITGSKDYENTWDGEKRSSRLFFSTVGGVFDAEGNEVEALNREVSFFLNEPTKWSKPMYDAFSSTEDQWFRVTLERIELKTYEVKGKKLDRYVPIFKVEAIESFVEESEEPKGASLPMPKPIFIQVCKANGLEYDGVFEYDGVAYTISDYVTAEEYSG